MSIPQYRHDKQFSKLHQNNTYWDISTGDQEIALWNSDFDKPPALSKQGNFHKGGWKWVIDNYTQHNKRTNNAFVLPHWWNYFPK